MFEIQYKEIYLVYIETLRALVLTCIFICSIYHGRPVLKYIH